MNVGGDFILGGMWMERPLSDLKDGATGVVCEIRLDGRTRRRLIEMGSTPGAAMRVKRRAPLGDPLEVSLRGYDLALRAEDACKILVREAGA